MQLFAAVFMNCGREYPAPRRGVIDCGYTELGIPQICGIVNSVVASLDERGMKR
jgi:hypothetical protein